MTRMTRIQEEATSDPRTFAAIGAAMAVHSKLGGGFLEGVYKEAMAIEMERRGIPFLAEEWLPITYDGVLLRTRYRCDFLLFDEIVIEAKAVSQLIEVHEAQVLNYLKAGKHPVGLLINFAGPRLIVRRFVNSASASSREPAGDRTAAEAGPTIPGTSAASAPSAVAPNHGPA